MILCEDFNARCGGLEDLNKEIILLRGVRICVDSVKNSQGEMLV